MWSQLPRIVVIGVASLVLAACGGDHKTPSTPASITIVSGNNQTGVAGSALPDALGVLVTDASGRPVAGISVNWTVVAGGGSVIPASSTTDSAGLATTNWTLGAALGANRVTASVRDLEPVALDATAIAGPPASVAIVSGDGQSGTVGTELPAALTVRVTDTGARPVTGATVTWAVTAGGGTVTPTTATTDSNGTGSTRWTLGTSLGANSATATVAGSAAVTFEATSTAGATTSVSVTSPTAIPYEGDTVQLAAVAKDQYGNAIPGKTATWTSSNPDTAPVSATGLLQAWGTGPVQVTANIDGIAGSVMLTLTPILATVTVGETEIVFDWSVDRCEDLDVPDIPSRIIRAEDGSLVLFAGNAPRYYVSGGAGFDKFTRDCSQPALVSADLRTPDSYENWEWIWSVYREGSTWHAFVHNEFHDAVAATCSPGDPSPGNPCWYNSVTHAVSTDGARSFTKPLAPAHVVAPAPNVWTPPPEAPSPGEYYFQGYRGPSNIVRSPEDGYYYALIDLSPTAGEVGRICLMRTHNLDDPTNWRSWDGSGFNLRMTSPYVTGVPGPVCANLPTATGDQTLSYNTYLDRYILLNTWVSMVDGEKACGYHYSLSADLIHWSEPRLMAKVRTADCNFAPQPGELESVAVGGPALVDHDDTTVNFERSGRSPHLYYARFNDGGLDRDLMRVQVTFTRTN
jgi:hypothetical protein